MQQLATPDELLAQLAKQIQALLDNKAIDNPLMVGIQTGGVWVASKLHQQLNISKAVFSEPLATLDISFYRDDFSRIGMNPKVKPSQLPPDVEDRHIILVDDVLHTGRTIRAAMNELFDYGRPASITLVCLIERSGRELPLQADIIGDHVVLNEGEHIKLTGPEPLTFELQQNTTQNVSREISGD
ncbi:MAG: bifunctional pyr operon transcriptional regulator/uracil phosphoribosyltransferase PyrR [Gammaproteobacteria bacterium]|jgi:pyrimidine operon attenuation protein/uracil phosphoribosyltransferase|nr:bifunctional pyr operon transcriptional regulator/uracil phosphoribosyltransferase PyrR [Gammaproteobacteria bacterium]